MEAVGNLQIHSEVSTQIPRVMSGSPGPEQLSLRRKGQFVAIFEQLTCRASLGSSQLHSPMTNLNQS